MGRMRSTMVLEYGEHFFSPIAENWVLNACYQKTYSHVPLAVEELYV